ncbi:unnamed protein product, partial [Symbiodinium natans]
KVAVVWEVAEGRPLRSCLAELSSTARLKAAGHLANLAENGPPSMVTFSGIFTNDILVTPD